MSCIKQFVCHLLLNWKENFYKSELFKVLLQRNCCKYRKKPMRHTSNMLQYRVSTEEVFRDISSWNCWNPGEIEQMLAVTRTGILDQTLELIYLILEGKIRWCVMTNYKIIFLPELPKYAYSGNLAFKRNCWQNCVLKETVQFNWLSFFPTFSIHSLNN